MGDGPETFNERQQKAEKEYGTVVPDLASKEVKVVDGIPRHPYTGNIKEATEQDEKAAKKNMFQIMNRKFSPTTTLVILSTIQFPEELFMNI